MNDGRSRTALVLAVVVSVAVVVLAAVIVIAKPFAPLTPLEVAAPQSYVEEPVPPPPPPAEEPEPEQQRFVISAGGDVLIHMPVANSAWNGERYQFSDLMTNVTPYLKASDVALCNMELPIRAQGEPPAGYPQFGAPYELVEELGAAGFTGCTTATNHALDQGWEGLVRTLDAFDAVGMGHSGTARSHSESDWAQFYTVEKGGVTLTIASIAATSNTNGLPLPVEAPWAVDYIDTAALIESARAAREAGADIVVASLHCCDVEYQTEPEATHREVAATLGSSGQIDIMVSHYAHVPQPMELLPGGPNGEGMWAAYDLGNLISNQGARHSMPETTESGILAFFYIDFDGVNPPVVTEGAWAVVTVDYANGHNLVVANEEGKIVAQQSDAPTMSVEEIEHRRQVIMGVMSDGAGSEQVGLPDNVPGTTTVIPRGEQSS